MIKQLTHTALAAALVLACRAHAETIEDGRFWFNVNATGATAVQNLRWYAELQPRWRDEGARFDQVLNQLPT